MSDASLYVSFSNIGEMEQELNDISLIHKNNLEEVMGLKDDIKRLAIWEKIGELAGTIKGQCSENRKRLLETEREYLRLIEEYNTELNELLIQEASLQNQINDFKAKSKGSDLDIGEAEKKQESTKKDYDADKIAFNVAKKMYDESFGLDVTIQKDDENEDIFRATVLFKEDCKADFTINRSTKAIIDFSANFLDADNLQSLKTAFTESRNILAVMTALHDAAI